MVLLACYECGNDVSSSAASCPKCGAPFEPQDDAPANAKPAPVAPPPLPVSADAPAKRKKKDSKVGIVVLALFLLSLGCYRLATKSDTDGATWLAIAIGFLLLVPLLPKRLLGLRPKVVCRHCNVAGHVFVHRAERKRGISGGRATGALLTGGLSLFLTGLPGRKWCRPCGARTAA